MDPEKYVERYFELMLDSVRFRAMHFRSTARMLLTFLLLQAMVVMLTIRPKARWWLTAIQGICFLFCVFILGRCIRQCRRRAKHLDHLAKTMLQFRNVSTINQAEVAREQIEAALSKL